MRRRGPSPARPAAGSVRSGTDAAPRAPPRTAPLAAALAAAMAVALAALSASCVDPMPAPKGDCVVLASWEEGGEGSYGAFVTYRITSTGTVAAERWGLVLRVDSDRRRYWSSIGQEFRLPPGASTAGTLEFPFAGEDERYVEGSAAVDSFWVE